MTFRSNKAMDMAHMMIKQAKMLKSVGLFAEARALARRALAMKGAGHAFEQLRVQMQPVPVRIKRYR